MPFQSVFALDFEFVSESGANPVPVCLVARELRTDRLIRLWQDELTGRPPFPINDDTLFVAYFAPAELGCFLELGWPVPTRVLDLYTEFRNATNGVPLPNGRRLLSALSHHGISAITAEQKTEERAVVMRRGPWSAAERRRIPPRAHSPAARPGQDGVPASKSPTACRCRRARHRRPQQCAHRPVGRCNTLIQP